MHLTKHKPQPPVGSCTIHVFMFSFSSPRFFLFLFSSWYSSLRVKILALVAPVTCYSPGTVYALAAVLSSL